MNDLISVIIPIYNAEKYLKKCLNSVVSQTYKNLEILLINDGSSDRSLDICYYFQDIDNRIQIFTCLNSGAAFARNLGLSKCNGKYIMFVDSDDYILPETIDILYSAIKKYEADISTSYVLPSVEKKYYDLLGTGLVSKTIFMNYLLSDKIKSYLMNRLYKKELWTDIRFPNEMKVEDLAVLYKVIDKADKIVNVNKELYKYTEDNPNSETRTNNDVIGLYPRCIFNFERLEFAKKKYIDAIDEVLYQAVSYGNICYFKMNKSYYNEQKQKILYYFIKNKKNIMNSYTLPLYKKIEAFVIMHQWTFLCNIFSNLHKKKQSKD